MTRIGIDATSVLDELSGAEVHIHTVVDALARHGSAGDEVVLFVRRRPPKEWNCLPGRFRIHPLPTDSQAVATQVLLPIAARRERIEVLYCPAKPAPVASVVPVLAGLHDAVPWTRPQSMGRGAGLWYRWVNALVVRRRAHVAAGSHAAAQELVRVLPIRPSRLHVVGYALAPWLAAASGPHDRPPATGSGPYVLSLCRIEPRKDLATVLRAWRRVHASRPDHRLLLAGKVGWKVDDVVAEARRTPGVELIGSVDNADLPGLYAHASAFVTASREEGFGLPVLEAMAMGAPVVASAIPPHLELTAGAARMFEPGDAAGLVDALAAVLDDDELAEEMRGAGRARAGWYSSEQLADRLGEAFRAAAGR